MEIEPTDLKLIVLNELFAVSRLGAGEAIPDWALDGTFCSLARAIDEVSIICPQVNVPDGVLAERGWRCLKLDGPLDFSLVGVLDAVLAPLAQARIAIMAVSTFNTDYVLVKQDRLQLAVQVLERQGFELRSI